MSAPREFEDLLPGGGEDDDGAAGGPDREERGGLGSAGAGGGLGFVPAGSSAPGLGSSGARVLRLTGGSSARRDRCPDALRCCGRG